VRCLEGFKPVEELPQLVAVHDLRWRPGESGRYFAELEHECGHAGRAPHDGGRPGTKSSFGSPAAAQGVFLPRYVYRKTSIATVSYHGKIGAAATVLVLHMNVWNLAMGL
jgi:hypothetical protein